MKHRRNLAPSIALLAVALALIAILWVAVILARADGPTRTSPPEWPTQTAPAVTGEPYPPPVDETPLPYPPPPPRPAPPAYLPYVALEGYPAP